MNYIDKIADAIFIRLNPGRDPDRRDPNELALYRIYAVLALAKGVAVTDEDVHDAWSAWTANRCALSHPSLIPFADLSARVQSLDTPYAEAIRAVAETLDRSGRDGATATVTVHCLDLPDVVHHLSEMGARIQELVATVAELRR